MNDNHDIFEMQDPIPSDLAYLNLLYLLYKDLEKEDEETRIKICFLSLRIGLAILVLLQVVFPLIVFGLIWINLSLWKALICIIGLMFSVFTAFNSFAVLFSFFRRLRVKS